MAGIAGFDAHVRKLIGGVNGQLILIFFTAIRAKQTPELPLGEAQRAEQESLPAIAFGTQHRGHRLLATERTLRLHAAWDGGGMRPLFRPRLQEDTLAECVYSTVRRAQI